MQSEEGTGDMFLDVVVTLVPESLASEWDSPVVRLEEQLGLVPDLVSKVRLEPLAS